MVDDTSLLAIERETARYYDAEEGREGRPLDPRRIAARDRFIEVVRADGRNRPVLEIGTGPGRDALALSLDPPIGLRLRWARIHEKGLLSWDNDGV